MPHNLPDRFDARPLRSSETAFARRATDYRKPVVDADAADRADGVVLDHSLKVARLTRKEVADALGCAESNVDQWVAGRARAPIGRICQHFPSFEFAYLQTRAAQSEYLEVALTIRERRRA